jgi:predicted PurR-regulated permease PerM
VLVAEGAGLLSRVSEYLGPGGLQGLLRGRVPERLEPLVERMAGLGLGARISHAASAGATWLTSQLGQVVGATAEISVDAFLTVVTIFSCFADGPRLAVKAMRLSPLENRYEREFYREFRTVSYVMVYVNAVTALAQGVLGAVGFVLVGLPHPVIWAAMMAFFSFVPLLGTGLVWLPAAALLALTGRPLAGLFLAGWGLLVIGSVDNLVRPLLAKGRMQLHPLLVFLTLFGGLAAFGPIGVLLGPLIGSLFTAMLRIWQRDFVPRIAARRRPSVQGQTPTV